MRSQTDLIDNPEKNQGNNKNLKLALNIVTTFSLLLLCYLFVDYFISRTNQNPLLPDYTIDYIFVGSATQGLGITFGLIASSIARIFDKTLIALILACISILLFPVAPGIFFLIN